MARGDQVAQRRWRILMILGQHGGDFTALDVQTLVGTSSVTVHRDLTALVRRGLLRRSTMERDPSHRRFYSITEEGQRQIASVLGAAGREVPANVEYGAGAAASELLVRLSAASRSNGTGQVLGWRSGLDVAWWLRREHGIDRIQVHAFGIWAEGDLAIRFLVLADHPGFHLAENLIERLEHQEPTLPVNAILLVAPTIADEQFLLDHVRDKEPTTVIATTTKARLRGPDGPTERIWSTADSAKYLRLIELIGNTPSDGS